MDKVKIILENGIEEEVDSIFYLYNSKYYFIYTNKELDENGYVILYLVQVCKELKNTAEGPVDTGYMVGIEVSSSDEWKSVQKSITKIVDNKKNNTKDDDIKYLPISMISTLKIVSKKTFRLMKSIIEDDFKVKLNQNSVLEDDLISQNIDSISQSELKHSDIIPSLNLINEYDDNDLKSLDSSVDEGIFNENKNEVIIDYRAKFFEEQERNEQLKQELNLLSKKLDDIKKIIE